MIYFVQTFDQDNQLIMLAGPYDTVDEVKDIADLLHGEQAEDWFDALLASATPAYSPQAGNADALSQVKIASAKVVGDEHGPLESVTKVFYDTAA